jgi:hypothetical protein
MTMMQMVSRTVKFSASFAPKLSKTVLKSIVLGGTKIFALKQPKKLLLNLTSSMDDSLDTSS